MEGNSDSQSEGQYEVTLHVYDLSHGMAASMSQMLTGRYFEGIWHTGIVYNNREWYFGGGIFHDPPGQTPHARPLKIIKLGRTNVTPSAFHAFMESLRPRYRMQDYDLINHNCNNFTDEVAKFLLNGKGIPSDIIELPREALSTPLGQQLRPFLTQYQQQMTDFMGTNTADIRPGHAPSAPAQLGGPHSGAPITHPHTKLTLPLIATSKPTLFKAATALKAVDKLIGDDSTASFVESPDVLRRLASRLDDAAKGNTLASVALQPNELSNLSELMAKLDESSLFPCLDIIRLVLLNDTGAAHFTSAQVNVLQHVHNYVRMPSDGSHRGYRIVVLRLAANLFATPAGVRCITSTPNALMPIVEAVSVGLHETDTYALLAAATLAVNLSMRLPRNGGDCVVQTVSALVHALQQESLDVTHDSAFLLLLALGKCIVCNGEMVDLVALLELSLDRMLTSSNIRVKAIAGEVKRLLSA